MFDYYNRLFPEGTKPPSKIDIKNTYIKYGVSTKINMKVKGDNGTYEGVRKNAFLGNVSSFIGQLEGKLIQDPGIFDGMTTAIIGPNGTPMYALAEELLRKQNAWRNELYRVRSMVEENLDRTNLVSVCYNMLRLYFLQLFRKLKATPEHGYYQDGHIKITNKQLFGIEEDVTMWDSFEPLFNEVEVKYSNKPTDLYDTEVFYDLGSNPQPILITMLQNAHAAWVNKGPFLLAHSSPKLNEKIAILGCKVPSRVPELRNIAPSQMRAAIGEFVRKNGCYRDFEYAYSMLVGVLTRPVPRSAEAVVWHVNTVKVQMPQPYWIRGLAPELYTGAPYCRSPDWQDTYYSWYQSSMSPVLHSIAMMEAVYTEIFHLTRLTSFDDIDRDNFMAYATKIADCPNVGIMVDLVLSSLRYGREIDVPYVTAAGVDRLDTIPGMIEQKLAVTLTDPEAPSHYNLADIIGDEANLNIAAYAPVTYPSLSYGVNEDGYYLNADEAEVTVKHRAHDNMLVFTDTEEFSKYMSMMRLFGYDVVATSRFNNKRILNWSDNASGRYIYVHNPDDIAPYFTIKWEDIKKRDNSWMEIPTLYGDVTFSYKLGEKALTWFSGESRMGFASAPIGTIKRTDFEKALAGLVAARPSIKIMPIHKRADFRTTVLSMPISRPALAPASSEIASGQLIEHGEGNPDPTAEGIDPMEDM